MIRMLSLVGGLRAATIIGVAMLAAACAKNPMDGAGKALGSAPPGSAQEFVVSVGDRVFFESDQSDLSGDARATLDKQAQWLTQYNRYTFTIEGHADERGTREYNIALGTRRARMRTISYGKGRPVAVCNDISCWSQNRRAVTVLNGAGS